MRLFATSILCLSLFTAGLEAQQKKRVAVVNFDYATVQGGLSAIFGTNVNIGKGIADLLVVKLVEGGVYSVIERKALDKLLAEQNLSNSDRADTATAAKIGKLLGVNAIIVGSITQFGRDDKTTSVGGSALGGITGKYGLGGVGKKQSKAVVVISARLVDTSTGEILGVSSGKGESNRSGTALLGSGGSSAGRGSGAVDMTSSNFGDTILGEAVGQAVKTLASQLQQGATRLPTHTVAINGLVADSSNGTLILNIGSKAGVKVGDQLSVRRPLREIRDPGTGKVIRTVEDTLGQLVITEVNEVSAVGKYTGATPAKVGDIVRNQ